MMAVEARGVSAHGRQENCQIQRRSSSQRQTREKLGSGDHHNARHAIEPPERAQLVNTAAGLPMWWMGFRPIQPAFVPRFFSFARHDMYHVHLASTMAIFTAARAEALCSTSCLDCMCSQIASGKNKKTTLTMARVQYSEPDALFTRSLPVLASDFGRRDWVVTSFPVSGEDVSGVSML